MEAEYEAPTPTQAENDAAKLAVFEQMPTPVIDEDDADKKPAKSVTAAKPGTYKTRAAKPE